MTVVQSNQQSRIYLYLRHMPSNDVRRDSSETERIMKLLTDFATRFLGKCLFYV